MEIDASDSVALSLDDEELLGESVRRIECFVSNTSPLVLWYWDAEHPVIVGALEGQLIRITKLAKRTTLNRMVSALHVLCEPPRRAKKKEGHIKERLQIQHAPSSQLKSILLPFPMTREERLHRFEDSTSQSWPSRRRHLCRKCLRAKSLPPE